MPHCSVQRWQLTFPVNEHVVPGPPDGPQGCVGPISVCNSQLQLPTASLPLASAGARLVPTGEAASGSGYSDAALPAKSLQRRRDPPERDTLLLQAHPRTETVGSEIVVKRGLLGGQAMQRAEHRRRLLDPKFAVP